MLFFTKRLKASYKFIRNICEMELGYFFICSLIIKMIRFKKSSHKNDLWKQVPYRFICISITSLMDISTHTKYFEEFLYVTFYRNSIVQERTKNRGSNLVCSESNNLYFMYEIEWYSTLILSHELKYWSKSKIYPKPWIKYK